MSINFIILGAQKAATSALQAALRSHPEIYMPSGESAFFEDPDYASRPWMSFGCDQPNSVLRGIKRPDNLCSDQAILRIRDALPNARFIVVLREPITRAVSSHAYLVRHAHLPARPLNEGMAACLSAFENSVFGRAATVVSYGLYGKYLSKWHAHFPKERFLILSQKQVSSDTHSALRMCAEHLGIDPAPLLNVRRDGGIRSNNVGLYDPEMLRLARVGHLLKTKPLAGTIRREPRSIIPRVLGTVTTRSAEALARIRGNRKETLSEENLKRLADIYSTDLLLLREHAPSQALYWAD